MHVKDLAARYEAVAVRKAEASLVEDTVKAESVGNGQVRKLTARLERAVKEDVSKGEKDDFRKDGEKSESPRAVEAVQFEEAGELETIVPVSVADTVEEERKEGKGVDEKVAWFEKGFREKKWVDEGAGTLVKSQNKITAQTSVMKENAALESPQDTVVKKRLSGESHGKRNAHLGIERNGQSSSWGSEDKMDSGYESETYTVTQSGLKLIQLVGDISDDDLDNIDGVKYVEDFDSCEDCDDTLHRQTTIEVLGDDKPSAYFPQEFVSNDVRHDGCQTPLVNVESTKFEKAKARGSARKIGEVVALVKTIAGNVAPGFNSQTVFGAEPVTIVEEFGVEASENDFESADEHFAPTSPSLLENKASSRRPRVKSMGLLSMASSGIGKVPLVATEESLRSRGSESASHKLSQGRRPGEDFKQSTDRMLPASMRRLPKAKVMIARRRGQSMDLRRLESDDEQPRAHATMSMDDRGVRRLVREYPNSSQVLTGQGGLLDVAMDKNTKSMGGGVGGGTEMGMALRHRRGDEFRKKYDEFLDAEELGGHHLRTKIDEEENRDLTAREKMGNSKQRYKNRVRLFGKSGVKDRDKLRGERQKRHGQNAQRRSSVLLSGALDRVSMAADPWIDFITDTNTLPGGKKPFRGVMKKLFRRGRGLDLVKN